MTKRNAVVKFVVVLALLFVSAACNKSANPNTPSPPQPGAEPLWSSFIDMKVNPNAVAAACRCSVTTQGHREMKQAGLTYTMTWVLIDPQGNETTVKSFSGTTQILSGPDGFLVDVSLQSDLKPGDYKVEARMLETFGDKSNTSKIAAPFTILPKAAATAEAGS